MTLPDGSGTAATRSGTAATRGSAIYDLGYQGYDGPRLGRRAAIATLFWSSWRSAFGLGRSGKSKIVPWGLAVIALLPAAVAVGIVALVGDAVQPFNYDNYLLQVQVALSLFVAAQAPELVGGDQRNHVLSLYFSHAIQRIDYAFAKLAALTAALLMLTVIPQLILFAGKVLSATNVLDALGTEASHLVQILVSSLIYSITLAIIGLAISAFTPRRAYATGAIIAFFLVTAVISGTLRGISQEHPLAVAPLIDPLTVADNVNQWIFPPAEAQPGPFSTDETPDLWFVATLAAIWIVGAGVIVLRYRRMQA